MDTWTFLPVAGAQCANGTPTGVGVNRSTLSANLVIMLEGGGACWDGESCFVNNAAVHVQDTYDATLFQSDFASKQGPTTRDPNNPFSAATQVFVPYCSRAICTAARRCEVTT
ncbi:MAG: pectin acetylesterase-family hydrolase [Verrucomicrobiota bacterium]